MERFTCLCCQGNFEVEETEDQVVPFDIDENKAIVCNDCYQEILLFEESLT